MQNAKASWLDRTEEKYDQIKFKFESAADPIIEFLEDICWAGIEAFSMGFGFSFVFIINKLVPSVTVKRPWYIRIPHKILGLIFAIFFWIGIQIVIFAISIFANLFGMRRGRTYKLSENLLSWLPLIIFAFCFPKFVSNNYVMSQSILFLSYSIILLGLNILVGIAGQASLGHGAFVLIGGYAATIFREDGIFGIHIHSFPAIFLGGIAASIVGLGFGIPAVRVKGPYLALMTLGLMICTPLLAASHLFSDITRGAPGFQFDAPTPPLSLAFISQSAWIYYHALIYFILLFYIAHVLVYRSKVGKALVSISDPDGEEKSNILGVNVPLYKAIAFALSAFFGGIGGGLLTFHLGFVSPESVTMKTSLDYLVALVIGGRGSFLGSVFGAGFLAYQGIFSTWLAKFIKNGDQLLWGIHGVILILAMILAPRGIIGEFVHWLNSKFLTLPKRREHRRETFADYDFQEELMARNSIEWSKEQMRNESHLSEKNLETK